MVDSDYRSIQYTSDQLDEQTGETRSDQSGDGAGSVDFSYNSAGYMTNATNSAATYTYNYDIVGDVAGASVALPGADGTTVNLGATYDYNGDMTSLAANIGGAPTFDDPSSGGTGELTGFSGGTNDFVNNYAYNVLGELSSIAQTSQAAPEGDGGTSSDVTAKAVTFAYDADGRNTSQGFYNSTSELSSTTLVAAASLSFDHDSDLTDLTYTDGAGNLVAGYHYDYNNAGLVTTAYSYADTWNTGDRTSTYSTWATAQYKYDPDGQLANTVSGGTTTAYAVSYSNFADAPEVGSVADKESYADDPNGNRTSESTASATNRVLFDGTYYYQYDAAGNRTARYVNGIVVDGVVDQGLDSNAADITIYTYNNDDEMTGVYEFSTYSEYHAAVRAGNLNNGTSLVATMADDASGRMVEQTTYTTVGESQTSSTEYYVYDSENLVLVLNSDGKVTERELTGLAADQVFASEFPTLSGGTGGAAGRGIGGLVLDRRTGQRARRGAGRSQRRHDDGRGGRPRHLHGLRRADRRGRNDAAVRLRWVALRRGNGLLFHRHAALRPANGDVDTARPDRILGRAGQFERVCAQ